MSSIWKQQMKEKIKPKIEGVELVAQSHIFRVEAVSLTFSNGEHRVFERLLTRRPAVLIVPILKDSSGQLQIVLVKEYAVGLDKYELGFPKGLVDVGESPIEAAQRELQEEAGYKADQLIELRRLSVMPGYMMHGTTIVLAQNLHPSSLPGDEPEPLDVVLWPLDDVHSLIHHPDFSEGRSIGALWLALEKIKEAL